jgi:hypothetical protein
MMLPRIQVTAVGERYLTHIRRPVVPTVRLITALSRAYGAARRLFVSVTVRLLLTPVIKRIHRD